MKQQVHLLGWDADAGILNAHGHTRRREFLVITSNSDQDLSARGKLHCIADQVGQNLANPSCVAQEAAGQERGIVENQIEMLLVRFGRQHFHDIFRQEP